MRGVPVVNTVRAVRAVRPVGTVPAVGTLRTVCAYLDARRLLTTELYVAPPRYQEVRVRVELVALPTADLAEVQRGVEGALKSYFHPLTGGEDEKGWPFGGRISYSRTVQVVFSVSGVSSVDRLAISLDGVEAPPCTDVALQPNALAFSHGHQVSVSYDREGVGAA